MRQDARHASKVTHLLPAVFTLFGLVIATPSAGLVSNLSLDPEGALALPDARRRAGAMRSRNDLRDFMELASKDGRAGGGRGEKE